MKPTFIYYINISVYNITHTQTHTRLIVLILNSHMSHWLELGDVAPSNGAGILSLATVHTTPCHDPHIEARCHLPFVIFLMVFCFVFVFLVKLRGK